MTQRFSKKRTVEVFRRFYRTKLNCLTEPQGEGCQLIRDIAIELGILNELLPSPTVHRGTKAFHRDIYGRRVLVRDWDKRVSGRARGE